LLYAAWFYLPFALALKSAKSLHLPALPSANANVFAIRFSVKICKACGECAAFARDEWASYCKKSKPTNVKISITLVTGGGLKTGIGASAPVLPPPFFSTRQVFLLTNNFK